VIHKTARVAGDVGAAKAELAHVFADKAQKLRGRSTSKRDDVAKVREQVNVCAGGASYNRREYGDARRQCEHRQQHQRRAAPCGRAADRIVDANRPALREALGLEVPWTADGDMTDKENSNAESYSISAAASMTDGGARARGWLQKITGSESRQHGPIALGRLRRHL